MDDLGGKNPYFLEIPKMVETTPQVQNFLGIRCGSFCFFFHFFPRFQAFYFFPGGWEVRFSRRKVQCKPKFGHGRNLERRTTTYSFFFGHLIGTKKLVTQKIGPWLNAFDFLRTWLVAVITSSWWVAAITVYALKICLHHLVMWTMDTAELMVKEFA